MNPSTPQLSEKKKQEVMITPPSSPRVIIECPGAPQRPTRESMRMITPPSSPRGQQECPGAPKKKQCRGCYLFENGRGGENQAAHMEENGCLEDYIKLE